MQNNEYRGIFYTKRRSNACNFSNCYSSHYQKPTNQQVRLHIENWYHTNIPLYGSIPHKAANYRHFPTLKATPPKHNTSLKPLNHTILNRLLSFNFLYKSFNYFHVHNQTIKLPDSTHACQVPWQIPAKCRAVHAYTPYTHAK